MLLNTFTWTLTAFVAGLVSLRTAVWLEDYVLLAVGIVLMALAMVSFAGHVPHARGSDTPHASRLETPHTRHRSPSPLFDDI